MRDWDEPMDHAGWMGPWDEPMDHAGWMGAWARWIMGGQGIGTD